MTINQNLLAGLSRAPIQTQTNVTTSFQIGDPTNIHDAILSKIEGQSVKSFTFPTDLPKYHFVLIENEWTRIPDTDGRLPLKAKKIFKLQLPTPLTDGFEVNYEQDFNFLGTLLKNTIGEGGLSIAKSAGLTLNTFRTVTLSTPAYKTFDFTWKFSPKNFKESQEIRKITFALRKGMTPKRDPLFDTKLVLDFPYIYTMYFSPNYQQLFKIKPCVLTVLNVDYQGGNPFPGFYRAENGDEKASPPESVVVQTKWLELEYWLDSENNSVSDYKDKNNDYIPDADPFDSWNYYKNS